MYFGFGEFGLGGFPDSASLSVPDPLPGLLSDPETAREFLLRASPGGVAVDLSSSGYNSKPTDTPYQAFQSAISRPYNFNVELPLPSKDNPGFAGGASLGVGEILIKNSDASLDSVALLDWMEAQPDLYIGRKSESLTNFTRFSRGASAGVSWDLDTISILHRDLRFKLQKRLQQNLYLGLGSCLRFDGAGDWVSYGDILDRTAGQSFTVEILLRSTITSSLRYFASKRTDGNVPSVGWRFYVNASDLPVMSLSDGTNAITYGGNAITSKLNGAWHRVSAVVDRTAQEIRIYVDGEMVGLSPSIATIGDLSNAIPLYVGRLGDGSSIMNGDLDGFRFWSKARTQAEIQADMLREITIPTTSLELCSNFNESSGTVAGDVSGFARNGTITGATWVGTLEGDSSIAGSPKPVLMGIKRQISPKLVDPQRLVYQWHNALAQALDAVKDGGDPYTFGSIVSDIYASTPAAGSYNVMLSANGSYFRLGSNPIGVITCDARGDAGGALGYRAEMANIHRKVATQYGGLADNDLNLNTYAALLLKTTAAVGFYFDSEINVDAALDQISKEGGNGWWSPDRVTRISVGRLDNPSTLTPDIIVTVDDLVDPSKGGIFKHAPVGVRIGKVVLGYRKYNTVLTEDQVAAAVSLANRNDLGRPYRFVSATDPNASANADTLTVLTEIDTVADAQAECDRLLELWKVDRGTLRISMDQGVLSYFIGTVMRVVRNRYDLVSGKNFVVFGVTEDMGQYGSTDTLSPALFG